MRVPSIAGLVLGMALAGMSAHAQDRVWLIVASETVGMAAGQGTNRPEVERRVIGQCGKPACSVTVAKQSGCVGAVRPPRGIVKTFDGASRSEWDAWLARECPARNCATALSCAPVASSSTPTVPTVPSIPSVPKLPTIR